MRKRFRIAAAVALGAALIAPLSRVPRQAAARVSAAPGGPIQLIGPGGTVSPLAGLVSRAKSRVLVEAYALTSPALIGALQDAARRGVDVRVMLDPAGAQSASTLSALRSAGARTRDPNGGTYPLTHMDAVVVDTVAVGVATTSLSSGPLGGAYLAIDQDRIDVVQAASIFYDDWLRRPVHIFAHSLVVGPDSSRFVASTISGAGSRIDLYAPTLSDPGIIAALGAARARGVTIRLLTSPGSPTGSLLPLARRGNLRILDQGPGSLIIIDRQTVLCGSMDLTETSLGANRELGIVVSGAASAPERAFSRLFSRATAVVPVPPRPTVKRTVIRGPVPVTIEAPPLLRVGGQGLILITTKPRAEVQVQIVYPRGSRPDPGTGGTKGRADAHGIVAYRWLLSGHIKTGTVTVRITVHSGGTTVKKSILVPLTS